MKSEKGFTLIELLIVITIIGVLSSVLTVVVNPVRQKQRARESALKTTVEKNEKQPTAFYS